MQAKNPQSSDPSGPIGAEDLDRLLNLLRQALSNVAHKNDQGPLPHQDESALKEDGDSKSDIEKIDLLVQRVSALDQELLSFTNATRRLGAAAVLTECTGGIRRHLKDVKSFFQTNLQQFNYMNAMTQNGTREHIARMFLHNTVEQLLNELGGLAGELMRFKCYFDETGEFGDKSVSECLRTLEDDLRYWSESLGVDFEDQWHDTEVHQYINHLTTEIGGHLARLIDALKRYREVEVPTIQVAQEHQVSAFQNLSAVAAFFAGVNATVIQYSLNLTDTLLARWTNLLWILSLVLSITSAISSQISNHWRSAGHRTPQPHVPTIVSLWMTHIPLLLLGLSVFIFSSGLICFVFQVFGHHFFIPLLTSIVTSFMMFALIMIGLWIARERFVGIQGNSRQWLAGTISRGFKCTVAMVVGWLSATPPPSRRAEFFTFWNSLQISQQLRSFLSSITRIFRPNTSQPLPLLPLLPLSSRSSTAEDEGSHPKLVEPHAPPTAYPPRLQGNKMTTAERHAYIGPIAHGLQMELTLPSSVRHPQFSPDGRFLAGFNEDHLTIYKVDPYFPVYKHLPVTVPSLFTGFSWSHPGTLLCRSGHTIELWNVEDGEHLIITRPNWVDFAKWLPCCKAVVSIESGNIHIVDASNDITKLGLDRFLAHSLDITSDEKWLIAVATVQSLPSGRRLTRSLKERRIIVYDLERRIITRQIPMLSGPSYVSLSEDDEYALINFSDGTPPRLYSLDRTLGLLKFERQFELDDSSPFRGFFTRNVFGQIDDPDGRRHHVIMSVGPGTGRVVIWDLQTGTRFDSFPWGSGSASQAGRIWDVTWNPRPPPGSALMLIVDIPFMEEGRVTILNSPFPSPEDQQSIGVGGNVPELSSKRSRTNSGFRPHIEATTLHDLDTN